ncbi:MAG: tripartite tricarboxylate transporter substrate binding protein [Pseudomonadota bacterium]
MQKLSAHAGKIATLLITSVVAVSAAAQAYPNRPIKFIVPYAAGGAIDTTARAVAQKMGDTMGQPIVVDNRPGGNTVIGTEATIKSPADGYTFLFTSSSPIVVNPHLYSKLSYDAQKDLAPVAMVCILPQAVVVNRDLGVNNLKEFVALAKSKPTALSYGSMGSGSSGHLNAENLKQLADFQMTHVPYKGSSPAVTDLAGGQISAMVVTMSAVDGFLRSGKLKALAIASGQRSVLFPDVPTTAEAGYPNFVATDWIGIFAPAATPKAVLEQFNAAFQKVAAQPDFRDEWVLKKGLEPASAKTPQDFARFIRTDYEQSGKLVRMTGAKLD